MRFLDEVGLTALWSAIKGRFVEKEEGKVLSSNDYTTAEKTKLTGIATGANNYVHPNDVNTRHVTDAEKATWNAKASTAVVTTTANGLMEFGDKVKLNGIATGANNYSHPSTHSASMITESTTKRFVTDAEKTAWNAKAEVSYVDTKVAALVGSSPTTLDTLNELAAALGDDPNFATTVMTAVGAKVDKVAGLGLSSNDYTDAEKTKLGGIATGANNYTHPTTAGNKHIPSGGASGQILRWSASGTAVWGDDVVALTAIEINAICV